ncbi:hypothetical protein HYPBUDRAFT_161545 [Hyphopichia burtonii NRRL Y-1933]|uniref:Galactose oxidase n=1 Tax=Hyphopichia burtonii NRRL Y-1933 TaxID=984485 RepID=A0A1E4RLF0_9ASCO|nr:hypothetical protein HYPBUDRAFT_161545 [Hyphopichia burtonii NRRL Y-1933]ODV68079.1 hypothetical protein HYPBUDRAFT_161545 [Hyphopichia burtonii NRRL Y-1933]
MVIVDIILAFAFILQLVLANENENENWNTLYDYQLGKIYLHLKDNNLISLNFSITGFDNLDDYTESDIDYNDNQEINPLAKPPINSTLFLANQNLYAFTNKKSSKLDACGDGVLNLLKYNEPNDKWDEFDDELIFDDIEDASFYKYSSYLSSPIVNDTIYIYGGYCDETNKPTNRLLSFNVSLGKFSNITTSTKPQAFFGANNLLAPDPQTQLIIGGETNQGWLNMYQLAVWDFDSGWTSKTIESSDSSKINSRRFALVLPIFNQLEDNKISTFTDYYNVEEVLLLGGQLGNTDSSPLFAKLSLDSNQWSWSSLNETNLDYDEIIGAATIFDTLVIINSTASNSKRDTSYHLSLYNTSNLKLVSSVKENTPSPKKTSSSSKSVKDIQKKAILGTVIPVTSIALAIVAGIFIMKKRKQAKQSEELETIDYQFGNYYDQQSIVYHNDNDTSSTLDVASIDSWVKKRQEFEENRNKIRNSYLASNETLSHDSIKRSFENNQIITDENPFNDLSLNEKLPKEFNENGTPIGEIVNRSVTKLKKSFSFTNTPPGSPIILKKPKSSNKVPLLNDKISEKDEFDYKEKHLPQLPNEDTKSVDISQFNRDDGSIGASIDDTIDAQVLISSKRRSKLRVVNPDIQEQHHQQPSPQPDLDIDIDYSIFNQINLDDDNDNTNIRKRVPSGDKQLDE